MTKKFDDWLQQQVGLKTAPPTYSAADATEIKAARKEIDQVFDTFLAVTTGWNDQYNTPDDDNDADNPFTEYAAENTETPPPPVHAARVTTGSGKTRRVARKLAQRSKSRRDAHMLRETWLYTVPTHYLSEELAEYFREVGLTAKVYYGRRADDRSIPGNMDLPEDKREKMCLALEKVAMAEAAGKSISESCCKYKKQYCEYHPEGNGCKTCSYQEQLGGEQPDVWIASHQMLFHPQKAFGKLAGVIIDENFVIKSGVYGIAKPGRKRKDEDDDTDEIPGMVLDDLANDKCEWRESLIETLREHPLGGLQRDRLISGKEASARELAYCKHAIGCEWDVVKSLKLTPEMSPDQIEAAKANIAACRRARWMVGTWGALREMVKNPEIETSGRLTIAKNKADKLVLQRRGIRPSVKACQIPCFIMDATLPSKLILQDFFPQVEIVAKIDVKMPEFVYVEQLLDAPVSKLKLWGRDKKPAKGENREAVRRYILQCWLEIDGPRLWDEECQREPDPKLRRKPMLVICQKKFRKWLEGKLPKVSKPAKLPEGIALEHFNNISGLDRYKDVAGEMLIGRIIPSPEAVEAYVGALTGAEPAIKIPPAKPGKPRPWYKPVERAIRLADGTGVVVERCDLHPDVMAEAVRLMLCENEMIQAFGRSRAINRDAPEKALKAWLVNNVVLDLTVNEVSRWTAPNEVVEPLALDETLLTAPGDMAKAWPDVWPTARAAKWTLKKLKALARGGRAGTEDIFSGIKYIPERMSSVPHHAIQYQRAGAKQKFYWAFFIPRKWPVARVWFEARGWAVALREYLWPGEVPPMAGAGKLNIDDAKVTVLKRAWETLDQLFDRAARHPWRKLPEAERAPSKPRYKLSPDYQQQPTYTGNGRAGRYTLAKDYQTMPTYDGSPGGVTTPHVDAYSNLPLELRMRALGSTRMPKVRRLINRSNT